MSSDKSAIERTQELLNERGVKHVGKGGMTKWTNEHGCVCRAYSRPGHLTIDVAIMDASPEQAIAATLGTGTCHITREPGSDRLWYCDRCKSYHEHPSDYAWEFCPRCGAKAVKE